MTERRKGAKSMVWGATRAQAIAQVPEDFRPYAAALYDAMHATNGKAVALMLVNADDTISYSSFIHPETVPLDEQESLKDFMSDVSYALRAVVSDLLTEDDEEETREESH